MIRIPLFLAAFFTAFFAGYRAGDHLNPFDEIFNSRMELMIRPDATIPNNNQFNILIIGVDDMDQPDANLESIWLAAHTENSLKITFIPVFPSPDDPDHNLTLADTFNLDHGKPGKEFWDEMRKTNFWWKGYLIGDRSTLIKIIDVVEGARTNGHEMNSTIAVSNITSWKDDPWIAINHQKLFLESICKGISSHQSLNLKEINEILSSDFRSSAQTKIFLAGWTARAISNDQFTCTFPTLTKTSFQSTNIDSP